jgi:hypothetical protein
LIEDALIELNKIFHDRDLAAPARLEAFKSLAKVADVFETQKIGAPTGERVQIQINLGNGAAPVAIEGASQLALEGEIAA